MGVVLGLVDMLNLARTGLLLGSVGSSFSEVASWLGATEKVVGEPMRPVPTRATHPVCTAPSAFSAQRTLHR